MIKLIVTDMDGTLLNDNHQLPTDFFEVEQQLLNRGIVFAVASGRQYYNLYKTLQPISERLLILADNGTIVKQGRNKLFVNPLDSATANLFIQINRTISDTFTVLCGEKAAYIEDTTPHFVETIQHFFEKIEIVSDLTQVEDVLLKVSICDFKGVTVNSYPHFKTYTTAYKIAISSNMWLDITHTNANKGVALTFIQNRLEISPQETMVFGDMQNDLEMIQQATHSYAMKNAHPDVTAIAKYSTNYDNNNDGVLEVIKRVVLTPKYQI